MEVINLVKSFVNFIFLLFIALISRYNVCYGAITISGSPTLNFGTIMQNSNTSSITLDYTGAITAYSGIYRPGNTSSADTVTYQTSNSYGYQYDVGSIYPENATLTLDQEIPGCTAYIRNVTPSASTEFTIRGSLSLINCRNYPTSVSLQFGATLELVGQCEPRDTPYTGTITIPSQSIYCSVGAFSFASTCSACSDGTVTNNSSTVKMSVLIDAPLSLTEVRAMSFGSILPKQGGTVVLAPDDKVNFSGVMMYTTADAHSGLFNVDGIGGKQVYITLPSSATLYNQEEGKSGYSMTVNSFTASATEITLPNTSYSEAIESFSVGATLIVGNDQEPGFYSGTYNVIVSY